MGKKNLTDLLIKYRQITSRMTQEKYDYLKRNLSISPVAFARLALLRRNGANDELLARVEYYALFKRYANKYHKMWEKLDWGNKEDESLDSFADGALNQEINEEKQKGATR